MFQPEQAALLAWTLKPAPGTLHHRGLNQPQYVTASLKAAEHGSVRRLTLTTGFTLLLLVLALAFLASGSRASPHPVVAAPPVFCNTTTRVPPAGEAERILLSEPSRSWVMCVQPHARHASLSPMNCWVRLWDCRGLLHLMFP